MDTSPGGKEKALLKWKIMSRLPTNVSHPTYHGDPKKGWKVMFNPLFHPANPAEGLSYEQCLSILNHYMNQAVSRMFEHAIIPIDQIIPHDNTPKNANRST